MSASQVDGRTLAERYLTMSNDHDPDGVDDFVAVDYINHNPAVEDGREATVSFGGISSLRFQTSRRQWTIWWWPAIESSDDSPTGGPTTVLSTGCLQPGSQSRCVRSTSGGRRTGSSWSTGTSSICSSCSNNRHDPRVRLWRWCEYIVTAIGQVLATLSVLAVGIVYGTDVFCAIVLRPALALVDDLTLVSTMGRVHHFGDRRLRLPGIVGIVTAIAATAVAATSGYVGAGIAGASSRIGCLAGHLRSDQCPPHPQERAIGTWGPGRNLNPLGSLGKPACGKSSILDVHSRDGGIADEYINCTCSGRSVVCTRARR